MRKNLKQVLTWTALGLFSMTLVSCGTTPNMLEMPSPDAVITHAALHDTRSKTHKVDDPVKLANIHKLTKQLIQLAKPANVGRPPMYTSQVILKNNESILYVINYFEDGNRIEINNQLVITNGSGAKVLEDIFLTAANPP